MFLSTLLLATTLLASSIHVSDLDGHERKPLDPAGPASVLFFVTNDCPVANSYAPEIQHICSDYAAKGVSCTLVYSDLTLDTAAIRKHHAEYGYPDTIPPVRDTAHKLADITGATITPQAVVVGKGGNLLYRGRIDNFYAALGKPRRQATEHDLRQALDEVLAGKPVTHPRTTAIGCYIPR
jgi:AhpC/TSA family